MPELPEVETTCRGISPHIKGKIITNILVRQKQLRWTIPDNFKENLVGSEITDISRRAKYILLDTSKPETIIIHLGMSGSLRILKTEEQAGKHDHVDFVFNDNTLLRYNDPRRFGAILYTSEPVFQHKLINQLGPEPFSKKFTGEYLHQIIKKQKNTHQDIHNGWAQCGGCW